MMTSKFTVTIHYGTNRTAIFKFSASSLATFKTELLKRFGNLLGSNRVMTEKPHIKALIKNAINIDQLTKQVNRSDHWRIKITYRK